MQLRFAQAFFRNDEEVFCFRAMQALVRDGKYKKVR